MDSVRWPTIFIASLRENACAFKVADSGSPKVVRDSRTDFFDQLAIYCPDLRSDTGLHACSEPGTPERFELANASRKPSLLTFRSKQPFSRRGGLQKTNE
jgi:hypothetical protein